MKIKREKRIRNVYEKFTQYFDFPETQKVLVDGNFLKAAMDINYNVEKLSSVL